jgi:hypothetical protein
MPCHAMPSACFADSQYEYECGMSFCPPRRIRVRIHARHTAFVLASASVGQWSGLPLLAGGVLGLALTQIIAPSSMNESWIDAFARIPGSSDAGAPVSKGSSKRD